MQVQEELIPMEELVEEEEAAKKADMREAPPTRDSAPEKAPALPVNFPVAAGFWVGGPSDQVAGQGPGCQIKCLG